MQSLDLPEMLFPAGSGVDAGRIDTAVPQQTGQMLQILLTLVETAGKQVAQIMRKDLPGRDLCPFAKSLHHSPDVAAVDWFSRPSYKNTSFRYSASTAIAQEFFTKPPGQQDCTELSLIANIRSSSSHRFYGNET